MNKEYTYMLTWSRGAFILKEAQEVFPPSLCEKKGKLFVLYIDNVIIRFKKFNNKLLAGNVTTDQAKKYSNQGVISGFSKPTINLNAGYVLNRDGYTLQSVHLTRPKTQYENFWALNMGDFIDNELIIPEPEIMRPVSQTSGLIISIKESAKEIIRKKKVSNE